MAKEICVICGCETAYDEDTPIDKRLYYMEGQGQVCDPCAKRIESNIQIMPEEADY